LSPTLKRTNARIHHMTAKHLFIKLKYLWLIEVLQTYVQVVTQGILVLYRRAHNDGLFRHCYSERRSLASEPWLPKPF